MPQETITVLRHPTNLLAKVWRKDGAIRPYDEGKYFKLHTRQVSDIRTLSQLLTMLEGKPQACLIRGRYLGDEAARANDPEYKPGAVRRVLAVFEDQPLHTCLVEVDTFEPVMCDPVDDPVGAIEEYIAAILPAAFYGVSYHWQLSNSAGHPDNASRLKAHIWFWLATPYTSQQLRTWSKTLPPNTLDASVFNPVQVHYTSAPQFEAGVVDPVPVRSGFVEGLIGDEVDLVIDETVLAQALAQQQGPTRQSVLKNAIDEDPIVHLLREKGMVKSQGQGGQLYIDCPLEDNHSSKSGPTSTTYYPPNTGGYARGAFVCLHNSCHGAGQHEFQLALGYDPILGEFTDLTDGGAGDQLLQGEDLDDLLGAPLPADVVETKDIPEAQHLCTDLANAERILRKFKGRLIVTTDRWFAWTGTHWAQDDGEVYVSAVKLSKIIHEEAKDWERKALKVCRARMGEDITLAWIRQMLGSKQTAAELPGEVIKSIGMADSLAKWAVRSEMRSTIDAALYLAKKMLAVPEDKLDRDPWALNCQNGTIDLRTGGLRKHRPEDYITHCVPLAYDASATAPTWARIVPQITMEDDKSERPIAAFLQRWFGYCATGSTREQKFVVHWGSGRNGKSTIIDTVGKVLNGYAGTAPPGLLLATKNDRHPTEIASLFGKRLVTAHENDDGGILREGFVKQATGGDRITARYMRADFFEFDPTHKLQLLTNHKPVVRGQDAGIWGRIILVPYLASFGTPEEVRAGLRNRIKDTTVVEQLRLEYAGILNWIVAGAQQWFTQGLNPPPEVLAASDAYRTEQDRILTFIMECCEVDKAEDTVMILDGQGLYPAYQNWCQEGGIRPISRKKMAQELVRIIPHAEFYEDKVSDAFGTRRKIQRVRGIKLL